MTHGFDLKFSLLENPIPLRLAYGRRIEVMELKITFTYGTFSGGKDPEIEKNESILESLKLPKEWDVNKILINPTDKELKFLRQQLTDKERKKELPRYCLYVWLNSARIKSIEETDTELAYQWFEHSIDLDNIPEIIQQAVKGIDWESEAQPVLL